MKADEKRLLLTDRWFPLPDKALKHPEQIRLKKWLDEKDGQFHVAVVAAGRRSFKTERFLKRHFVRKSIQRPGEQNFLGAPTRPQAKMIFWEDVKALVPTHMLADKPNETELRIDFNNGSKLFIVGLQEYHRVEGTRWNRTGITEYQEADARIFGKTLQAILNDTKGEGILEGRPMGKNHFYDDFMREKVSPERWGAFQWTSEDILEPEQIAAAKDDLGLYDYQREYLALFDAGSQKVYYGYTAENNKKCDIDPDLPLIIACDFNAGEKPMSWVIGQQIGGNTFWTHALAYQYTNTAAMCGIVDDVLSKYPKYPPILRFYGDYSGVKATSNSSFSDWEIIENFFNNKATVEKRIRPCFSVRDRNASTNARLCNANNVRRMFVDPDRCKPLIKDWEYVQRKDNGIDLDDSNPERTHSSDAVDYYADYEFPVKQRVSGKQYVD